MYKSLSITVTEKIYNQDLIGIDLGEGAFIDRVICRWRSFRDSKPQNIRIVNWPLGRTIVSWLSKGTGSVNCQELYNSMHGTKFFSLDRIEMETIHLSFILINEIDWQNILVNLNIFTFSSWIKRNRVVSGPLSIS